MKKVWKNIKLIFKIFSLSHNFDSKITLYEFLHGLCLNLRKVINVIMPGYIVNLIVTHKQWLFVLFMAVIYGLLQCLLGCGEKSFKLLQEAHGFKACNLLRLSMNKKFMRMDYADTENSSVIDSFEEAKDSMWEFSDVGYVLFDDIIGNLITFFCMSYILSEINILIYLFVLILVSISIYIQYKKNNRIHESELKEQVMKKWCDYVSGLMQNYKVGKEIRLFDIKKFMLNKYNFYSEKYKKQIREREKK